MRRVIGAAAERLAEANWYMWSAAKGFSLMREMLFDRVYALRVPRFARNYGRTEVDMHFSLKRDLTPLRDFLEMLRSGGIPKVTHMLASGKM